MSVLPRVSLLISDYYFQGFCCGGVCAGVADWLVLVLCVLLTN
jgi:hypothetical protein